MSRPKRTLLQLGALVSAILVIVPMWELATSTTGFFTDLLKSTVSFEIEPSNCGLGSIGLSFANFEKDRFLEWSKPKLISINDEKFDKAMTFKPNQRRHMAPLSVTHLTFHNLPEIVEKFRSSVLNGSLTEAKIMMSITATEPDGARPTSQIAICTWFPTRPPLIGAM